MDFHIPRSCANNDESHVRTISILEETDINKTWLEIMMQSSLITDRDPEKLKRSKGAVCLRSMRKPTADLIDLVSRTGKDISKLTKEEFCAAHLVR